MRKEDFGVGSVVHVYNKGNRKQPIVLDDKDRWRFVQMLYYFNSEYSQPNLFRKLHILWKFDFYSKLEWPDGWPDREPLVKILAVILKNNHYHLILEEIKEGGITMFMRKLGTGMTNYFNTKHKETGRLFQGSYKARRVDNDNYLKYLIVYVQVKNAFEIYPGGLRVAVREFNKAYDFAINYPYSSLSGYVGGNTTRGISSVLDKDMVMGLFGNSIEFKEFAQDCILNIDLGEELGDLTLED